MRMKASRRIIFLLSLFGFLGIVLLVLARIILSGENDIRFSNISYQYPARKVKSVQGVEYPFHDPYNMSQVRLWRNFHGNIDSIYSIDELLKMHEQQNSVTITGFPPKSPLLRTKKLRIISTHFTRTDLLRIQYFSIKRFLRDFEWEYVVVNAALEDDSEFFQKSMVIERDIKNRIRMVVESFDSSRVSLVEIPEKSIISHVDERTDPASRCANVMQWCLENLVWNFDGYVLFLDADSFFYDDINVGQLFIDHGIVVGGRNNYRIYDRKKYDFVTNNLLMLDPQRLPNRHEFRFGRVINEDVDIDAGAESYNYFMKYPHIHRNWFIIYQTVLEYPLNIVNNLDHLEPAIQRFFLEDQKRFFGRDSYFTHVTEVLRNVHYKRGSNWDRRARDWQVERGQFWMDFWTGYFGCDDHRTCSNIEDVDRRRYSDVLFENLELRREIRELKKKC